MKKNYDNLVKILMKQKMVSDFDRGVLRCNIQQVLKKLNYYYDQEQAQQEYKEKLFKGQNFQFNDLLKEYEKLNSGQGPKLSDIDTNELLGGHDNSAIAFIQLQQAIDNMETHALIDSMKAQSSGESYSLSQALSIQAIDKMFSDKMESMQKKTAFKVMKRYYKNVKMEDFSSQVNFDKKVQEIIQEYRDQKMQADKMLNKIKQENDILFQEVEQKKIKLENLQEDY